MFYFLLFSYYHNIRMSDSIDETVVLCALISKASTIYIKFPINLDAHPFNSDACFSATSRLSGEQTFWNNSLQCDSPSLVVTNDILLNENAASRNEEALFSFWFPPSY